GVRLAGQDQHIEALVGFDEGVHQADGVGGMDVVVHVAVDQEKVAPEIGRQLGVSRDLDFKTGGGVGFLVLRVLALLAVVLALYGLVLFGAILLALVFIVIVIRCGEFLLGRGLCFGHYFLANGNFLNAVVALGPGVVVDVVVMVAGTRDGHFEELVIRLD